MIAEILHRININQYELLSRIERSSPERVDARELEDSALIVFRSADELIKNLEKHLKDICGESSTPEEVEKLKEDYLLNVASLINEEAFKLLRESVNVVNKLQDAITLGKDRTYEHSTKNATVETFAICSTGLGWALPETEGKSPEVALDLGGTLLKVAYYCDLDAKNDSHIIFWLYNGIYETMRCMERHYKIDVISRCELGKTLRKLDPRKIIVGKKNAIKFLHFPSDPVEDAIDFLIENKVVGEGTIIKATGGGSYKHEKLIKEKLPRCEFIKIQETPCIFAGTKLMHKINNSFIKYDTQNLRTQIVSVEPKYPYLIVNIGSGICVLKVSSEEQLEWVTGTSIGGGTSYGLANMLVGLQNFDEFTSLYDNGTNYLDSFGNVDEQDSPAPYGLSSSFGNLDGKARREDLVRSIGDMISYNIGTIAFLVAKLHNVKRIIVTGSYAAKYRVTMDTVATAVQFMAKSRNEQPMELLIPILGSYVGALGGLSIQ